MSPVGSHGVGRGDSTQGDRILVGALVAHDTDATDGGEEDGTSLPNLVVERYLDFAVGHSGRNASGQYSAGLFAREFHLIFAESADVDVVGILQDAHFLAGDVAQDADGKARTGEGVTRDEVFGHLQLTAYATHFVLEQPLQGFAELEVHLLGQTAHVVVALDDLARDVERLDAVGIDGALSEPFGVGNLLGLGIEHFDEVATDDLTFLFGFGNACEVGKELLAGIDANDVQAQHLVVVHDLLELVLAQHAVVDEDTRQAIADGLVQQHGGNGAVDTARESEDDAVVAQLIAQRGDGRSVATVLSTNEAALHS